MAYRCTNGLLIYDVCLAAFSMDEARTWVRALHGNVSPVLYEHWILAADTRYFVYTVDMRPDILFALGFIDDVIRLPGFMAAASAEQMKVVISKGDGAAWRKP